MSQYDYDLFVIGAGSGGVRAARIASQHGARVAIAEEHRVGGTCVIRGCVPKKLMVYASEFADAFEDARGYGWTGGDATFDWPTLIANKDREIDRLNAAYINNLVKAGVELFMSRATVTSPHGVHIEAEGRTVSARTILIATGGAPFVDDSVPGIEHAITSNEVFYLERQPRRIAISGGGYIAVEFAGIFNGLGTETTLVYRRDEILRGFDDEVRAMVREGMEARGVNFIFNDVITGLDKRGGAIDARLKSGASLEVDAVMMATGRRPATAGLGLEAAGVTLTAGGAVVVDAHSRTSVPSIYAVGDVTDRINLTPVAIREGHAFADTRFGGKPVTVDHSLVPTAVFSQPEIGTVGLTEAEAAAAGDVDVYTARFRPMLATLSGRHDAMLMKVLVDADSDKVLGAHVVGHGAGELAQVLGIALRMGATKADFDATMAVHPTAAEELVTMRTPTRQLRREAA
ncbi:MAG: glutathione-disulfide reductase [Acuticoccus sp.]